MTSFKRWFGAGAIVLVALALVACPALVPEPVGKITPMTFTVGDDPQMISDIGDLFTNVNDRTKYKPESSDDAVATASITGTTLTVTPGTKVGTATVTITATLDNGKSATTSFMVTVKAAPVEPPPPVTPDPDNNQPRLVEDELPDVNDLKFRQDPPWTVDLEPLFTDDEDDELTFTAMSRNDAVAVASVMGSTLTLTAARVEVGDLPATARIDVFADDGEHDVPVRESFTVTVVNQAPMKVTEGLSFNIGLRPGGTDSRDLTPYFTDPESHTLTYSASVAPSGVAMASTDGATLTIEAGMTADDATVTVTANDGAADGTTEFILRVSDAPNQDPVAGDRIPDQTLTLDFDATKMIEVTADHFSDPDGDMLTYTPASSMEDYVTVSADGSMITITAVAAGMSTITVTASDSRGGSAAMSTFDVTVMAPAVPTWKKEIPDVTFEHDGGPHTITLAEFFNRATMYDAQLSSDSATDVVTPAVNDEQTMLTLTRIGPGDAVVEITPSNSGGDGPTQSITVMVKDAPRGPVSKDDMEFEALTRTAVADGTAAEAANMADFDLTKYFEDPDRLTLTFSTTTDAEEIVAVYDHAKDFDTEDGEDDIDPPTAKADLDKGTKTSATHVGLRARKVGTAEITVVATDAEGLTKTEMFTVTVIGWTNDAPSSTATALPADLTNLGLAASRLKSTAMDAKTVKVDLGEHFADDNVADLSENDTLTFSAKTSNDKVAMASVTPTGNKAVPYEHNVVVTPVGSGTATITLIAKDSFGVENTGDPKTFNVRVNHRPMPYGAQAEEEDRTTLGKYEGFMNLDATAAAGTALALVDTNAGYFSDMDTDDTLTCAFRTSESGVATADKTALVTMNANALSVDPQNIGSMTIDVWCSDTFEESEIATVRVEVDRGASIQ